MHMEETIDFVEITLSFSASIQIYEHVPFSLLYVRLFIKDWVFIKTIEHFEQHITKSGYF